MMIDYRELINMLGCKLILGTITDEEREIFFKLQEWENNELDNMEGEE